MINEFTRQWDEHQKRISYFISQMVPKSDPDFDDIFQDIMMIVHENRESLKCFKYPLAWIYKTTRNYCIDHLRKRKSPDVLNDEFLSDNRINPETIAVQSELFDAIDRAIDSLSPDDRLICYLYFFEEMKYKKIGDTLNLNVNTIKTRMRSIKRKLRDKLKDEL